MKIKVLALFIFILSVRHCYGQADARLTAVVNQLGNQLNADIATDGINGSISVAIIKNNAVVWAGAYGYAAAGAGIKADTATIYRIGSITKSFTATLLLQLVQEGKIRLDDPAENYLPEIKKLHGYADAGIITFRQLASHTSGLKREPDMSGADIGPTDDWDKKVLECIPRANFNSRPGQQFLYSNIGFAILGLALQRVTGVPYIQMVQQRILTPLHMNDTFFTLPGNKRARLAEGLENSNGSVNTKLPLREINGRGYRVPNGGIFSTPRDLAKFVTSMTGSPALLTSASLRQMQNVPEGGSRYGLGLMLMGNGRFIGHNGSVPGYTSQYAIDGQSGYAIILMRNYNKGTTNLETAALSVLKALR